MSSRYMAAKITLTSVLVFAILEFPSSSQGETIGNYYSVKCSNRAREKFPTAECSRYLKCDEDGRAEIENCSSGFFNITSKKCEPNTTPPCQDTNKVTYHSWKPFDQKTSKALINGIFPLPATMREEIKNFSDYELTFNQEYSSLLQTRFLAVVKGNHTFKSKCIGFCKIWVQKTRCGKSELVLDQKMRTSATDQVEYNVQKNYTMEFGTFYYLDIVHVGDGKNTQFKVNVTWQHNNNEIEMIDPTLLRLPDAERCPNQLSPNVSPHSTLSVHPSPTGIVSLTGTLSHTENLTPTQSTTKLSWSTPSLISKTISLASSSRQSSVTVKSSPALHYSTPSSTRKTDGTTASTPTNKMLNVTTNPTNQGQQTREEILNEYKKDEFKGEEIAKKWNKKGENKTVWSKTRVSEVHFPVSNYTFPRRNYLNQDKQKFDEIFIPAEALMNDTGGYERKIYSMLYLDDNLQQTFNDVETEKSKIHGSFKLNSHVILSVAVPAIKVPSRRDIVIRLLHLEPIVNPNITRLCAFLKWGKENNSLQDTWSTEGCTLEESDDNITVCKCNHLTHFGILMQVDDIEINPKHEKALKVITYIGCSLSLIAVCLTVLVIMCLPGARSDRNFVHVNLAVAIALAQITFLAGIDEVEYQVFCTIVAALLHYFLLVAFSWMLMEGIFLHILIVKVFHDHLPRRRCYVTFCWGLPLVIVLLSVNLLRDGYGTETSCWLSADKSTIWTFSGPAILIIMINIVILCKVMKEINSLRTSDQQDSNVRSIRYGVRSAIILLPLLGLTWAFGLLCVNDSLVVFQYLFTIFNSLQGLFIFLFHCVFNTEVRKAFWRKVDIWFTNHNSPFANHGNSASSFKKDKDDPSSTGSPDKGKNLPQKNGSSMYCFNDLTERERRKLSTATASTCLELWPNKLSWTPSLDNGPYPNKFTPSSDDIKYQAIYKVDAGQKKITPKTLKVRTEDLNGNTRELDRDAGLQSEENKLLAHKDIPNGNSVSFQNNESRNVQPHETETHETDGDETQSKQQNIAWNSGNDTAENLKSNEEKCKQQEEKHNQQRTLDETVSNQSQQKPPLLKKSSFEEERTVGIGGQPVTSRDSTGCVRIIDVNSSSEKNCTKL